LVGFIIIVAVAPHVFHCTALTLEFIPLALEFLLLGEGCLIL